MSLFKYVMLYDRLRSLIEHKCTGTPEELSEKLGISRRQTSNYIRDLKALGHPIVYNPVLKSYVYSDSHLKLESV